MATLNFTTEDDKYVATFKAEASFNLHIEQRGAIVKMSQTSVEGTDYAYVRALNESKFDNVIDTAVIVPIPPVWIKIVSRVKPTMAVVTFPQA